jgi:MSHA biogenesis protein MshM
MIRAFFGLSKNPFELTDIELLKHQEEVYETLKVHSQQGGLCLVMGEPGTGKTVLKEALKERTDKRTIVVSVARTLHTYTNTLKVLCQAMNVDENGIQFKCERRLIEQAYALHREGKSLITIIDEAHLMEMQTLRKLRLLFEDFPRNHNLILVGQTEMLANMSMRINEDLKSRITYSTTLKKLNPEDIEEFICIQLDKVGLGHNTFSEEALGLIVRSASGFLRRTRNLCLSCLLEAVRAQSRTVSLEMVNRVLIQPHWREEFDVNLT